MQLAGGEQPEVVAQEHSILVVDDDELIARGVSKLLRGVGYDVAEPACSADVARARILDERPGLVVMDVNLGRGASGIDIATEILRSYDVPIVFLTGEDDFAVGRLSGHDGIFAFLPKPIGSGPLHSTIQLVQLQHQSHKRTLELQALLAESQRIASIGSYHVELPSTLRWSEETFRLHGVDPATFAPTPEAWFELCHPDDRATIEALFAAPPAGRVTFEFRIGPRHLRAVAELRQRDGVLTDIIGTVQDITVQERALAANRAKTEFLANMSHELRTPLNAVLGLSEAMLEQVFGTLVQGQRTALETIHASGRHLLALINDVLDIARVESGKLPVEREPTAVRSLVDETVSLVESQLAAKQQTLAIELDLSLPPIDVDRRRLKQVLLNLVGNASKFSPAGTPITIRASATNTDVRIDIIDRGPGIPVAERERVFQPFVMLDPSSTRAHDGAGLGLALARRIAELHGGTIVVATPEGERGSVFRLSVPVSETYVGTRPGVVVTLPQQVDNLVALIVEDHHPTSLAVRSYLESLGWRVVTATDGAEALSLALGSEHSVIVMDVNLPVLDGLEVIRRLRRERRSSVPIIAVTAHAMPGDEERCLEAGATKYMPKPIALRTLADSMARLARETAR